MLQQPSLRNLQRRGGAVQSLRACCTRAWFHRPRRAQGCWSRGACLVNVLPSGDFWTCSATWQSQNGLRHQRSAISALRFCDSLVCSVKPGAGRHIQAAAASVFLCFESPGPSCAWQSFVCVSTATTGPPPHLHTKTHTHPTLKEGAGQAGVRCFQPPPWATTPFPEGV